MTASWGELREKRRVEGIDVVRGVVIFGVVSFHTAGSVDWWGVDELNTVFFFLSGLFFRPRTFRQELAKDVRTLLVPFFVFLVLSFAYRVGLYFCDNGSTAGFDWTVWRGIFNRQGNIDYMAPNVALWFLLCLFWVKLEFNLLRRAPRGVVAAVLAAIWILADWIITLPLPFLISNSLYWLLYYAAGYYVGNWLLRIGDRKTLGMVMVACAAVYLAFRVVPHEAYPLPVVAVEYVCYSAMWLCVPLIWKGMRWPFMAYMGRNSLAVLCYHLFLLIPLGRVAERLLGGDVGPWMAMAVSVVAFVALYPIIKLTLRYTPWAVGRLRG